MAKDKTVKIKNPAPRTLVLGKRSIMDGWKNPAMTSGGQKNPIAAMNKSTALALNDAAYRRGLMAGRREKPKHNPIGLSDIMDLVKVSGVGIMGAVGIDIAAGQILPRMSVSEATNAQVYYLAKAVMAVVAGEILSEPTKGMSYTAAAGALTVIGHRAASKYLETSLPASVPLGYVLPQQRVVPAPQLLSAPMTVANSSVRGGGVKRAAGMRL